MADPIVVYVDDELAWQLIARIAEKGGLAAAVKFVSEAGEPGEEPSVIDPDLLTAALRKRGFRVELP